MTLARKLLKPLLVSGRVQVGVGLLWRRQHRLQVLLYFVYVGEHLPLESEERRVRPRGQVVKIRWPPNQGGVILEPLIKMFIAILVDYINRD